MLFHGAESPHDMFRRKASIVGWSGFMRTTGSLEMSMADFLDAHVSHKSERDGQLVPLFFTLRSTCRVRTLSLLFSSAAWHRMTPWVAARHSPPWFCIFRHCLPRVCAKLCKKLYEGDVIDARGTVQTKKIRCQGVKLSQLCLPHGHYISLVVSYPAEIASYFMNISLKKHSGGLIEITLTIDDSIFDLFSADDVQALKDMKRLAAETTDTCHGSQAP
ncbi:hypothetical protein KI688_012411 [Linnemannia hyalina]|uniref:Uncharacterized protein n=1 Tax=Linnemannia hyalina TaxID=64524 RepID=A0A9P7XUY4_9FUNG|nr:hypothetical protein KI688_012411 [Linnemannia hyalina]